MKTPPLLAVFLLGTTATFAQTVDTWTGNGTTDEWSEGANWASGSPPLTTSGGMEIDVPTGRHSPVIGDGSTVNVGGYLRVGTLAGGTIGRLTVTDGTIRSGNGNMGVWASTNGEVILDGTNVLWSSSGNFYIGNTGIGSLTIRGGATGTAAGTIDMGFNVGGNGTLTIAGGTLANGGTGGTLVAGGTFTMFVGRTTNSSGVVKVEGADSLLSVKNGMMVGYYGRGTLDVLAGGTVTVSGTVAAGYATNSSGLIRVSGTNSLFQTNALQFSLTGGTGMLTVENGGTVAVGGVWNSVTPTYGNNGTLQMGAKILNIGGTSAASGTTAGFIAAAAVNGGAGGTVNFYQTDETSFSAAIQGGLAVTQAGSGTTTLTAINTYMGPTNITAGKLIVAADASIDNSIVTVSASGALGGGGTIGGNTVVSGTLAPDGTLTFSSGLTINDNATIQMSAGDLIAITNGGVLNLGDTGVKLDIMGGAAPGFLAIFEVGASMTTLADIWKALENDWLVYGIGDDWYFDTQAECLGIMVVPEPGTWAMILGGLGMLAGMQRLRRKSPSFPPMKTYLPLITLTIAAAFFVSSAQAQVDRTWSGASGSGLDWDTVGNWAGGKPGYQDRAIFDAAVLGGTVTNALADQAIAHIRFDGSVGSLTFDGNNKLGLFSGGTLEMMAGVLGSGHKVTINTPLELRATGAFDYTFANHHADSNNTFLITGGVAVETVANTGTLTLSGANTGNNIISGNIDDGGSNGLAVTKTGAGKWVLSGSNSFSGGVNINGGTLRADHVKALGTGDIKFGGGTLQFGADGVYANSIKGSGSTIMFDVGNQNVEISGNIDSTNTGGLTLTGNAGATGTLTLSGSSSYTGTTRVNAGTLNVTGTMSATTGVWLRVGDAAGANGAVIVDVGTGKTWNVGSSVVANTVAVGNSGTGSLTVKSGTLAFYDLSVGDATGGNGLVTVSGSNSALAATRWITIGNSANGVGKLIIENGGKVSAGISGASTMGSVAGSKGTAIVKDEGSLWTVTGAFHIGYSGTGEMRIENKGQVTGNGATSVGSMAAGTGSVTVTGTGSLWKATNTNFTVGGAGKGQLTIENGGEVAVGAEIGTSGSHGGTVALATSVGSVGTLNIGGTAANSGAAGRLNAATVNGAAGTAAINFNQTDETTFTANITKGTGTMTITQAGSGTTILTGNNTFAGRINVNAGAMEFRLKQALNTANYANITVASGAMLAFGVGNATNQFLEADITAALAGINTGFGAGSTIGFDTSSDSFTYNGVIANTNGGANTLGVTKLGAYTLTLTGNNTYAGSTNIEQGTLALGSAASIANSGTITVASGATFDVQAVTGFAIVNEQTLTGNGIIVGATAISDGATLAPDGTLTFQNGLTINENANIAMSVSDLIVITNGVLALENGVNLSISGDIAPGFLPIFDVGASTATLADIWKALEWLVAGIGEQGADWYFDSNAECLGIMVIPEPGTWVLLVGGLGVWAGIQRLRRRK